MRHTNKARGSSPTSSKRPKAAHAVQGGSSQANRLAIALLEVLAGLRTPADAAGVLQISLPRYYQLETRALEGLVAACEPRPQGRQPSWPAQVASLEKQLEQARRECARQQALVRLAQRSLGLKAAAPTNGKSPKGEHGSRKKRRPTVRALRAVAALRENIRSTEAEAVQPQVGRDAAVPPEGTPQPQGGETDGNRRT